MGQQKTVWDNPADVIRHLAPEHPVMVFAPTVLQDRARQDERNKLLRFRPPPRKEKEKKEKR